MKITKVQFNKWSEEFGKFLNSILEAGVRNRTLNTAELATFPNICALIKTHVEMGTIWAVVLALEIIKSQVPESERKKPFTEIGGRTFNDWENEIKQKLKDHCSAGGYYDPNKPLDLANLDQRRKNIKGWWREIGYRVRLLLSADPENKEYLKNVCLYLENCESIFGKKEEEGNDEEIVTKYYFLIEDLVSRVEKAKQALEEKERQNPPQPVPDNNNPPQNLEISNPKDGKIYWVLSGVAVLVLIFIIFLWKKKKKIEFEEVSNWEC